MRLAVVALSLTSLALPASAQLTAPQRRAGYWEQTVSMAAPRAMTMKSQFCTDPTVEKRVSALGQAGPGQNCPPPTVVRTPGGFTFESTCQMAGRTTHTKGTATGDFQSSYRLVMDSQMTPPIAGQGSSRMQIDSKWLGPCPAGKKPGDMTMPNGMTVNILSGSGRPPPPR
jgi:hypothetical protein